MTFDTGRIHPFMLCDCVDVLLCGCCVGVMWVLYGYCVGVVWLLCGCVVAPSLSCTCSVRGLRDGCKQFSQVHDSICLILMAGSQLHRTGPGSLPSQRPLVLIRLSRRLSSRVPALLHRKPTSPTRLHFISH